LFFFFFFTFKNTLFGFNQHHCLQKKEKKG